MSRFSSRASAQRHADGWTEVVVTRALYHLAALGADQHEATLVVSTLAWSAIRNPDGYVRRFNDKQSLRRFLSQLDSSDALTLRYRLRASTVSGGLPTLGGRS